MFAFCSRFDVKYPCKRLGCLFVWSVIVQQKNSWDSMASFCIRIRLWFGDCLFCLEICVVSFEKEVWWRLIDGFFCWYFFLSFFLLILFFWENADLMIWLFCRLAHDHPNEKNSRICSKERTHFWKCLQLFWGEVSMGPGCLFVLSVIVETKKKNSRYTLVLEIRIFAIFDYFLIFWKSVFWNVLFFFFYFAGTIRIIRMWKPWFDDSDFDFAITVILKRWFLFDTVIDWILLFVFGCEC